MCRDIFRHYCKDEKSESSVVLAKFRSNLGEGELFAKSGLHPIDLWGG